MSTVTNPQFYNIQCSSMGTQNTLLGSSSGLNIGAGSSSNTLIGYNAGLNVGLSSSSNTAIGVGALGNGSQLIGSNNYNVAVGFNSLQYVSSTGVQNIGIWLYYY